MPNSSRYSPAFDLLALTSRVKVSLPGLDFVKIFIFASAQIVGNVGLRQVADVS